MNQVAKISTSEVNIANKGSGSSLAPESLGEVVRFAEVMAKGGIALPAHLRGEPGACMAVAMQALEWGMSPFAVAMKSYSVKGAIAYEAQLIAAVVNTRSGIKGRLKYDFQGEGASLQCTVSGEIDGETYTYTSPRMDQITIKNSPLWKTDPQQQLGYYSARSWARRHTPEVLLGVYDRDEAQEMRDITPPSKPSMLARVEAQNAEASGDAETEGFSVDHVLNETQSSAGETQPITSQPALEGEVEEALSPADSASPEIISAAKAWLSYAGSVVDYATDEQKKLECLEALANLVPDRKSAVPEHEHEQLKSILRSAEAIIKGDAGHDAAVAMFSGVLEVDEDALRGE